VAYCGFPASKPGCFNRAAIEAFFLMFPGGIQEKELPITVAGQQWFRTIFPSISKLHELQFKKSDYNLLC